MGVLRWRSALDEEITQTSSKAVSKLDLEVLTALRLAVYQLRRLDRIPPRAAIHESVELVKRARKRSAAPFVNAVLRKLAAAAPPPHASTSTAESFASPESLARALAHPLWLVERWVRAYGLAAAHQICQYDQSVPATAIRLRDPAAENDLRAEGIDPAPGALLASARRVSTANISQARALLAGQAVIQDEASQLVAALVGRGARILDCCAAPGGKTLAMADYNPDATITAVELHPHRARLLQKLLRSAEASLTARPHNIQIITADLLTAPLHANFDRVLVDVPCSGTGTLARNPEIKWRLQPEDLEDLGARQFAILRSALTQVAPGGRLIYSTCSLEKAENENVVEEVLEEARKQNSTFRLIDVRPELDRLESEGVLSWPDPASLTRGPFLRTLPGIHPCDGFFAAIFEKL
jgi:16S rRNA (cytosine967-C5)-methyltransferase